MPMQETRQESKTVPLHQPPRQARRKLQIHPAATAWR